VAEPPDPNIWFDSPGDGPIYCAPCWCPVEQAGLKNGNPVRVRGCPAAVNGNELRRKASASGREAAEPRNPATPERP